MECPHPRSFLPLLSGLTFWGLLGPMQQAASEAAELWDGWNRLGVVAVRRGCLAAVV